MKSVNIILGSLALLGASEASAQEFFCTEPAEELFTLGVRLGMNSSNRTFNKDYFQQWNVNSWGTGFNVGFVFDLNMRDYFSLQPGFFFDSRSGNYSYAQTYWDKDEEKDFSELGHYRVYNFTIPVMLSFHFNLNESLRWNVEAGPYAQFKIHASDNDKIQVISPQHRPTDPLKVSTAKSNFADFGLKIGTGFQLNRRYSINVHYLAGGCNVWKEPYEGGKNKSWMFTLGYDF